MTFTIKRSKWLRGAGAGELLREDDHLQCCVGQMCSQLGVPDNVIEGECVLEFLSNRVLADERLSVLITDRGCDIRERKWVETAYGINDETLIADDERERQLADLAAANGHELVFTD
jgi:hypothetical protein